MDRLYSEKRLKVKMRLVLCAKKWINSTKNYKKVNAVRNYINNLIRESKTKIYHKKIHALAFDKMKNICKIQKEAVINECEDAILKPLLSD